MNKGIRRDPNWNSGTRVGIGYICLPTGVDREKFVQTCYRKEKVNIALDQGGTMVKDCCIDSSVLQRIKFPQNTKELGSQIVFVTTKFQKIPFVIACLTRTQERIVSEEESFNIQREINGGLLSIVGKGDGKLLINLENTAASKLILNINGKDSILEINNDGTTTINSEKDITINSSTKVSQNVLNEDGDIQKSLSIDSNGMRYEDDNGNSLFIDYENGVIKHNDGEEAIPKGNSLKIELEKMQKKLNTFLNTFSNTVPVGGDGGAAIQTAVKVATQALEDEDFDDVLSTSSFIE